MVGLFGAEASKVTVNHLLRTLDMRILVKMSPWIGMKIAQEPMGHTKMACVFWGMQSGLADFDVKGFDDALLKQGTSVHSPLEFLLLGIGRYVSHVAYFDVVKFQKPCWTKCCTSVLIGGWCFHHMRHAAASQSPVFACSPGNCTSYTSYLVAEHPVRSGWHDFIWFPGTLNNQI